MFLSETLKIITKRKQDNIFIIEREIILKIESKQVVRENQCEHQENGKPP